MAGEKHPGHYQAKLSVNAWGNPPQKPRCSKTDVKSVIESSGILDYCPEIDLATQKIGVFGKFAKLDNPVHDGDRIEIYQRITRVLGEDDEDD